MSDFNDAVNEATNNFKSRIGKSLKCSEAQDVWNCVGDLIEKILSQHKSVTILGLGTFTISEWSLNTGLGKPLIISQPVFILAEKIVKSFQLRNRHPFTSDKVPCYMLHYKMVEANGKGKLKLVETCIIEVVQAFTRMLAENRNVTLSLGNVGNLEVLNKNVTMKFTAEFQERIAKNLENLREVVNIVRPWSPKKILE
uniref:CCDC81 HU domain-containing protein n=1 Tax=Clastoptera arizonana TaxID=38151 RepID=A0A1B6DXY7_9HEMI